MEKRLTEQEAIELTIKYGFDGGELDTKVWKDRGCLLANGTMKKLISKLKTIYNSVSHEGRGKKRVYILKDKKEQQTERKFNYKGTVASDEDEIMKHYVFNQLIRAQIDKPLTYRGWGEKLGFYNTKGIEKRSEELTILIKETYRTQVMNSDIKYNSNEVLSKFIQQIEDRNRAVIQNSFVRLQRENKIEVEEVTLVKFDDEKIKKHIEKSEYEKIVQSLRLHLESEGYKYQHYIRASGSIYKSKRDYKMIASGKKFLGVNFGIEFMYKAFEVTIVDNEEFETVSRREFYQAFFMRLITLAEQRQQRDNHKNSTIFWRKFNYFNLMLLLNYITDNFETHYTRARRKLPEVVKEYKQLLLDKKNEKHAFGKPLEL